MKKAPSGKWVVVAFVNGKPMAVAAFAGADNYPAWRHLERAVAKGSEKTDIPMRIYRASEPLHSRVLRMAEEQAPPFPCKIDGGVAHPANAANETEAAPDDGLPF